MIWIYLIRKERMKMLNEHINVNWKIGCDHGNNHKNKRYVKTINQ